MEHLSVEDSSLWRPSPTTLARDFRGDVQSYIPEEAVLEKITVKDAIDYIEKQQAA
jgi:hypothetical protein